MKRRALPLVPVAVADDPTIAKRADDDLRDLAPSPVQPPAMARAALLKGWQGHVSATMAELVDLAERIAAAHEAATISFDEGFRHAIDAGSLLIEAKAKLPHGGWLTWLKDHAKVGARMAQIYMRLAREVPRLSPGKAKRVSHLSIRQAMNSVSSTTSIINKLPVDDIEKVFAAPDNGLVMAAKRAQSNNRTRELQAAAALVVTDEAAVQDFFDKAVAKIAAKRPEPTPKQLAETAALDTLSVDISSAIVDAWALYPDIAPQAICDVLNYIYCEIQGGELHPPTSPRRDDAGLPEDGENHEFPRPTA
jgi:hypothetical protein